MNIFFKHEKFFLLCIFLNNALMAMDNNVKLLPRTEQEKFQPKKLIRIKGNENNGNTFWFDRKLLAPCAWLDQMLMLSESESLAHNDPKQPLVLPTATSTSLFQFKQLLQDLYKFDNQVPQSTTSASNSENESTSSFISLLLHSIPFNFSSTKSNIPEANKPEEVTEQPEGILDIIAQAMKGRRPAFEDEEEEEEVGPTSPEEWEEGEESPEALWSGA
jgi:hypothetical protein